MLTIKIKRATREQLDTAASNNQLVQGEPYLITDEDRIAVGLSDSTYEVFAKVGEGGGSFTVASAEEIDTGTNNEKGVTPLGLAGSTYKRIHVGETEPTGEEEIWIKTDEAPVRILQISDLTLEETEWDGEGEVILYELENANIEENDIVDVIPDNDDIDIVAEAEILPATISSAGSVTIYAKNIPTDDIGVTIRIYKR